MIKPKQLVQIALFVLSTVFVASCSEQATEVLPSHTATVVPNLMSISTPASVSIEDRCHTQLCMSSIPIPTFVSTVQDQFFDLLKNNGNCELPCFLGIEPGRTNWVDTKTILNPFVINRPIPYEETSNIQGGKGYSTQISTEVDKNVPVEMTMNLKVDVDQSEVVQHIFIRVELYGDGFTEFNDKHLSQYGLREIFLRNGLPNTIFFQPEQGGNGYEFNVVYDELKMAIIFAGRAKPSRGDRHTICPNIGDGDVSSMMIVVANPLDPIDVKELIEYPIENKPLFEDATGMTIEDFYTLIIGDQQPACLEI